MLKKIFNFPFALMSKMLPKKEAHKFVLTGKDIISFSLNKTGIFN